MNFNLKEFKKRFEEEIDINIEFSDSSDDYFIFKFEGLEINDSFSIKVQRNRSRISTEFSIGSFAKGLMRYIEKRPPESKKSFLLVGMEYQFEYNIFMRCGTFIGHFDKILKFPDECNNFSLEFSKIIHNRDTNDIALESSIALFSLVNPLLPNKIISETFLEGGFNIQTHRVYERNKKNREMALKFHGKKCKACGFSSNGDLSDNFSDDIIEVHHTELISKSTDSHNPNLEDLVPLCPNCHSIAHKKTPPYSVNEIKIFIKNK